MTKSSDQLSIEQLRERIADGEVVDPIVFLESIMSGQDPRKVSKVLELVLEIDEMTGGEPEPSDWQELKLCVEENLRYQPVQLQDSRDAAKTLAEYVHPKKRSVDISGVDGVGDGASTPLNTSEIELFREKFYENF